MRAGVYRGIRAVAVEEVAEPELSSRDVILAVRACGICGSDLHAYVEGVPEVVVGQIMGHEFSGEVVAVGTEVEGVAPGDRVAGLPVLACGACPRCHGGKSSLCDNWLGRSIGFGLPGAFAEQVRIPDAVAGKNVFRLPDGLGYAAGALAEPTAVAVRAVDQAGIAPDQTAVVLGLGTIGLQIAQVLLARGVAAIVGVNRSALRRATAAKLGVPAIDGGDDLPERVRAALGGRDADVVFEATGSPALVQGALETVRPGGTIVMVALYERPGEIVPTLITVKEPTIRGSSTYMPGQFAEAVELLASGRVASEPLITQRHRLEELPLAFEKQLDRETTVKVMITMDQ
jgi:(R,R)-butanediol dehydrogenase/meso-butanediol dehydrogenase/diacetyl reductase